MEEDEIREALKRMENDPALITESAYRADSELWLDNKMPFADAHMAYLKLHPKLEPRQYLSNLRLRLRRTARIK